MKKLILSVAMAGLLFAACNSEKSEKDKEKQDSIAAAASADSMLKAATAGADSTTADSAVADTVKK